MSSRVYAATPSKPSTAAKVSSQFNSASPILSSRDRRVLPGSPDFRATGVPLFSPGERSDRQSRPAPVSWLLQAKLAIGSPSDPLEREADRIADHVLRMPAPRMVGGSFADKALRRKCASCAEEERQKTEETRLSRKSSYETAAPLGSSARALVHEVCGSPGKPLDAATREFMEPRFGRSFSSVRVHTEERAATSANAVGALAYTVGEHIVFAHGQYAPQQREGRGLLAHELGHVVQQGRHTGAPQPLQRDPAPPVNKWDRIAHEVFARSDYNDYLMTDLRAASFFGHSIPAIHPDLAAALKNAETSLLSTQGAAYQPPNISRTLKRGEGMHGWGMAIDFDVVVNPYVLNEAGEKDLDKELIVAYDHIAQFILGAPRSALRKLTQGRSAFGGDVAHVYDALLRESNAMKDYFAMKDNDAAIAAYLSNQWPTTHPGQTPPALVALKAQMKDDYEVLGGATASGPKRPTNSKADRPFAPHSGRGTGDPATGFLNLRREFVLAMTGAGLAWGAIDFGGESGDIQHFDTRRSGAGARVISLMQIYK